MKLSATMIIAFGIFFSGATFQVSAATPLSETKLKKISCDDTKISEIASIIKSDPGSVRQLDLALAGDADAALQLAVTFGKIDFEKMMCLEKMAAENGNPVSQKNYGQYLSKSDDALVRKRGEFWLNRAKNRKVP